jgi:hypothetical protein
MKTEGLLGCTECSRRENNWIVLGQDEDGQDVRISGVKCDVVAREANGLRRLRCGAIATTLPMRADEWVMLEINGKPVIQRGDGLGALYHDGWEATT